MLTWCTNVEDMLTWYQCGGCSPGTNVEDAHLVPMWGMLIWYQCEGCSPGTKGGDAHLVPMWGMLTWYQCEGCSPGANVRDAHLVPNCLGDRGFSACKGVWG